LFQAFTSSTNKTDIFLAPFHYHVSNFYVFFISEATGSNSFITFIISQIKDRIAGLLGHKYDTANSTIRRERSAILNKYGELKVSMQFGSNECNYQILLVQGVVARLGGGSAAGPSLVAYAQFAVNAHKLLNVFLVALTERRKVLGRQHTGIAGSNLAKITFWC
jgi:hypothetical protein